MLGKPNKWEYEKSSSVVQNIIDTAQQISMGRGDSGIIVSPYVASLFEKEFEFVMIDVSSEEYKTQQKERHQQEIRKAAEEWK